MGKVLPWILAAFLAIGCLALLDRSCGDRKALKAALVDVASAKAETAQAESERAEIEATASRIIRERDKRIADLLANAGQPTPAEVEKDREISALKAEISTYKAQGDLPAALASAEATISALEVKFNLAEDRHKAALLALNSEWQGKFDALQAIADARLDTILKQAASIAALEKALGLALKGHRITVWDKALWAGIGYGTGKGLEALAHLIAGK